LDIAFVRDVYTDPARRAVARALIGFAAEVGAVLVAEGIETTAELDQLRRLGAGFGQGYYLAPPAPPHLTAPALPCAPAAVS
jgi:EAL domain-containing protein (putative c-di-GMP-specific phosphodiesterase class I)